MPPRQHRPHPAAELDPDLWIVQTVDSTDAEHEDEQLGSKEKFWVRRTQDERQWLLKLARGVGADTRGEDWAEWVVHKIAQAIGVPSAIVVPATWKGRRGILSRSFIDIEAGERLVHGNERLAESDSGYDSTVLGENPGYTVARVRESLDGIGPPSEAPSTLSAFDVWSGFVMLDALVAGRDRHHENWGVVRGPSGAVLAPSFDHGNALAFQESDEARDRLLRDPDRLRAWLQRGRSRHFARRPTLIEVARQAKALGSKVGSDHWHDRLVAFGSVQVDAVVASIPVEVMSDAARNLAIAIVRENRRRLLDDS